MPAAPDRGVDAAEVRTFNTLLEMRRPPEVPRGGQAAAFQYSIRDAPAKLHTPKLDSWNMPFNTLLEMRRTLLSAPPYDSQIPLSILY